ncbi:hypothetical protein FB45DRAFT_782642 [Roridomyces roridus]|uniref:Uncharacterized protein n=1 Tax=Roridomyces roridus TaxID=1738132 RepID=A0AAD7CG40_9AGAR|nr:hypothetical protein FB45DRAFT_782642 [Roridomyces roridus]
MAFKVPLALVGLLSILLSVAAQIDAEGNFTNTSSPGFESDPYLKYRPPFARSLPVQILLTGVVLTLVAVLFIHLIFTAQYHWPLAPVNYVLQISGVSTLLISLVATLHLVLQATMEESQHWPYMLSYIAVSVPPLDNTTVNGWNLAQKATWMIMNASTSGLIQITHIQFLTLLYPSRLEARLIFALLGPLAIVAAIMQLIPISGSNSVNLIASEIRNVCNATLSVLFTTALFIWGLLVRRKDAWRTDGGTAAFGCGALALALVSTGLNFLYVPREEEYMWLPGLMWAVVLWQSFLGWWWWVGAGNETLEKEELERMEKRQAKRAAKKMEARQRRSETKARAKVALRGVAGVLSRRNKTPPGQSVSPPPSPVAPTGGPASSVSLASSSSATTSALPHFIPLFLRQWYHSLRIAHNVAAHQQAVEHEERIRELERTDAMRPGWGLGSFAWRTDRRRRKPEEEDELEEYELHDRTTAVARPRGFLLWGPLGQWRLKDSTVY